VKEYLKKFGNLDSKVLAQKLQEELASTAFEVHTFQFPRGLTLVKVDTSLQARDYLTMKTSAGVKVFSVAGMEVFDNGRIMGETAGPVLVLVGHTSGLTARKPQVKVMSLLPDEVVDHSDKIVPELKGEG